MKAHGETRNGAQSVEYRAWWNMQRRCYETTHISYPNYGWRGVTVCRCWRKSFSAFLKDVGRRPAVGYSLDRLENNRPYEPGNVVWATRKTQNRNTRRNRYIRFRGARRSLAEWVEQLGLPYEPVKQRLRLGWSAERALTEPVKKLKPRRVLTAAEQRELRRAYQTGGISQCALAEKLGIDQARVSRIVHAQVQAS